MASPSRIQEVHFDMRQGANRHESGPDAILVCSMEKAGNGAEVSAADLFPLVYESLKQLARQRMSLESCGHTLQATALVHEAYLRLARKRNIRWSNRAHFFYAAAEAMRQILIEHARARGRVKRGGGCKPLPIHLLNLAEQCDCEEVLALDEAVRRLEQHTPEIAAVVRFRFFAGLSVAETAELLGMGRRSVDRAWSYARVWLYRELYGNEAKAGS